MKQKILRYKIFYDSTDFAEWQKANSDAMITSVSPAALNAGVSLTSDGAGGDIGMDFGVFVVYFRDDSL